jgi:ATPase subunit of ABC transporter with duplicated ATPase domains
MQFLSQSSQKIWSMGQQPLQDTTEKHLDVDCVAPLAKGNSFSLQPKLTLSVEGNISAGKSTFLQILQESGIDTQLQVRHLGPFC